MHTSIVLSIVALLILSVLLYYTHEKLLRKVAIKAHITWSRGCSFRVCRFFLRSNEFTLLTTVCLALPRYVSSAVPPNHVGDLLRIGTQGDEERRLARPRFSIDICSSRKESLSSGCKVIRRHAMQRPVAVGIDSFDVASAFDDICGRSLTTLTHATHMQWRCTARADIVHEVRETIQKSAQRFFALMHCRRHWRIPSTGIHGAWTTIMILILASNHDFSIGITLHNSAIYSRTYCIRIWIESFVIRLARSAVFLHHSRRKRIMQDLHAVVASHIRALPTTTFSHCRRARNKSRHQPPHLYQRIESPYTPPPLLRRSSSSRSPWYTTPLPSRIDVAPDALHSSPSSTCVSPFSKFLITFPTAREVAKSLCCWILNTSGREESSAGVDGGGIAQVRVREEIVWRRSVYGGVSTLIEKSKKKVSE